MLTVEPSRKDENLFSTIQIVLLSVYYTLSGKLYEVEVGGQAVLGRQDASPTPWLTERHGYDPTCVLGLSEVSFIVNRRTE